MVRSLRNRPWHVTAASLVFTLGVWEWYGRGVDPIFLSYPSAIMSAFPRMIGSGELPDMLMSSLQSLVIGFTAAIIVGIVLGLITGRYKLANAALKAQITALYSTPTVSLIPLFILWFGLGLTVKTAIVFLAALFPITINTHGGVRNIQKGLVEIGLVEGASERQIFSTIILPGALPFIMTGIKLSVGRAVVGMVVAEMFTAISGLGGGIIRYGNAFATDKLFVVIIVLALLGLSLTGIAGRLEKTFSPWRVDIDE